MQLRNARLPSEQRTQQRGHVQTGALHTQSRYSYSYTGPVPSVAYVMRTRTRDVVGPAEVGGEGSVVSYGHGLRPDLCADQPKWGMRGLRKGPTEGNVKMHRLSVLEYASSSCVSRGKSDLPQRSSNGRRGP